MIKLKLYEMVQAMDVMNLLGNQSFSGKATFAVARLMREMTKEYEVYDKSRQAIINKYGEKDENGELVVNEDQVKIKEDCIEDCNRELSELLTSDIELTVEPLDMAAFDRVELTPVMADKLMPFIK